MFCSHIILVVDLPATLSAKTTTEGKSIDMPHNNDRDALSIKQNMLWNSSGSIVYLACQWLITVLVVRLSNGYDAAGVLALGMAVSNIISPIGYYKIRSFQVSDIQNEYSPNEYIALRLVTIGAALVVMLFYGAATCSTDVLFEVYLYGIYSCGPLFADVFQGIDQQKMRMDIIGKDLILRGLLSITAFVLIMLATNLLAASIIGMIVVTFLELIVFLLPKTKALCRSIRPVFNACKIKKLLIQCLPAVIALFFSNAVPSIPRQVLGDMYGSTALGAYASIAAPVLIVQMGAQYVYSPLLGIFATKMHDGDYSGFLRLFSKTTFCIILITLLALVFFLLFGEQVFGILYGESITAYMYLLTPLVICTALTAFIWFIGDLLIVLRMFKSNLIGYLVSFIVCSASMSFFLSTFGLNGASYAIITGFASGLACFLIMMIHYIRAIRNQTAVRPSPNP